MLKTRMLNVAMISAMAMMLSACAETELATHYAKQVDWPGQQTGQGKYKVGNPYRVENTWYYPKEDYRYLETGIASWYGPDFHGKKTANGERYDQHELTAAHRTLPMPSLVRVTNLQNGRSVVVRINDRGPFKRGRIIDVSQRAAELLGFIGNGTAQVKVEVLEAQSRKMADAAKRGMDTSRMTLADVESVPPARPYIQPAAYVPQRGVQVASLSNDAEMLPDSLKTPTITVEELNNPSAPPVTRAAPAAAPVVIPPPVKPSASQPVPGHLSQGVFMPDAVVTNEPVSKTGIFVQAGSFSVEANAQALSQRLSKYAPAKIDLVDVNGRKLYRVKLGPLANVAEADKVLAQVVRDGSSTARVIH